MRTTVQNGSVLAEYQTPTSGVVDGDISFLRLPQVKAATGLSKTSIYEKIKDNAFPSPVPIGKRAVGWVASEIRQWAAGQVALAREERRHLDLRQLRRGPVGDYRGALRRSA